jgi:uncharacterized repeat protein (TIGR02059 family)
MNLKITHFAKFHLLRSPSLFKTIRLKYLIILSSIIFYFPCLAQTPEYYGTNWGGDGLANTTIGEIAGRQADYRFRAQYSGDVTKLRLYLMYSAGYGSGTGGKLTITLETDDGTVNHFPSGTVLTNVTDNNPMSYGGKGFDGVLYTFQSTAKLTQGNLYHLRFTNSDADPINNFVSINSIYMESGMTSDAMPTGNITDLAFLRRDGTKPFQVYTEYMPIYSLYYSDGLIQGQGYIGASIGSPRGINGSGNKVRSSFTVSGPDKVINKVSLRLKKISGTDALTVRLEDSGGTLIEQGTIAAANISSTMTWVSCSFLTSHVLSSGSTYHLVLNTASGSTYQTFALQDGSKEYGYIPMFSDGFFQYTTNGSTWNNEQEPNFKAQIYFSNQTGAAVPPPAPSIPIYQGSVVNNATPTLLEITYDLSLVSTAPVSSSFIVKVNSVARAVTSVAISGTKVQLTLASGIKYGEIVTVSYTKPASNPLQTSIGGVAASYSAQTIINNIVNSVKDLPPVTMTMTINPIHVYSTINVQLAYSSTPTATISPEILRIFDLSGKLFIEKLLVTGVTGIKFSVNLRSGIYFVKIIGYGAELASQKIRVY